MEVTNIIQLAYVASHTDVAEERPNKTMGY
jgi:hypothetical protein